MKRVYYKIAKAGGDHFPLLPGWSGRKSYRMVLRRGQPARWHTALGRMPTFIIEGALVMGGIFFLIFAFAMATPS